MRGFPPFDDEVMGQFPARFVTRHGRLPFVAEYTKFPQECE
jgi:hypothetical protein